MVQQFSNIDVETNYMPFPQFKVIALYNCKPQY